MSSDELILVEQNLSKFIGPMAKMLVRLEAARAPGFKEFLRGVAGNIDQLSQRELFLLALKRALPRRF